LSWPSSMPMESDCAGRSRRDRHPFRLQHGRLLEFAGGHRQNARRPAGASRASRGRRPSISSTLCRATPPAGSLRRHLRDSLLGGQGPPGELSGVFRRNRNRLGNAGFRFHEPASTTVIASGAKQSLVWQELDCLVADAPRNDELCLPSFHDVQHHLPPNFAGRFSRKAVTPSLKSSVAPAIRCDSNSRLSWSSNELSGLSQ